MLRPAANHIAFLVLVVCLGQTALADEVHLGRGGFSIDVDADSYRFELVPDKVGDYTLWGYTFLWQTPQYGLVVNSWNVSSKASYSITPALYASVLQQRKQQTLSILAGKANLQEVAFPSKSYPGYELRSNDPAVLVRGFFLNRKLYEMVLQAASPDDLAVGIRCLDSFRPLTKEEQMVALIEESAPHELPQKRPTDVAWSDASELGLRPGIKRIRDIAIDDKGSNWIVQEIHFDESGFKTREIAFNGGYPDVITSWGWLGSDRINLQSPVNYPPGDGPLGGRTAIVTGYAGVGKQPPFGNKILIKVDVTGRSLEKRSFTVDGKLGYIVTYTYSAKIREVSTTDATGGFIGRIREQLDEHGNVIQSEELSDNGAVASTHLYQYTFDKKQNWISRKEFVKNYARRGLTKLIQTVNRDIIYYEQTDRNVVG